MITKTLAKPEPRAEIPANARFPSALNSCALLEQFVKQENAGVERKPLPVQPSKMGEVAKLDMLFSWAFKLTYNSTYHGLEYYYHHTFNRIKLLQKLHVIDYTAADLAYFTQNLMKKYEKHPKFKDSPGFVLTALINACKDPDMVIFTDTMSVKINHLGTYNEKNLTVYGDAGDSFCAAMKSGNVLLYGDAGGDLAMRMAGGALTAYGSAGMQAASNLQGGDVVVNGNVGYEAGEMLEGGSLTINGDAGADLGKMMRSGIITLNGNAGIWLADQMKGGTINVNGKISLLGDKIKGGNIFQNGRQLMKDGKIIAQPENK